MEINRPLDSISWNQEWEWEKGKWESGKVATFEGLKGEGECWKCCNEVFALLSILKGIFDFTFFWGGGVEDMSLYLRVAVG